MGSSSSKRSNKRVTFDGDTDNYIYKTTTHSRPQPAPVRQTIIERTYTDQDSFELDASRSRESTFSLGHHIKTKAEKGHPRTPDQLKVDRIIREHHHSTPPPPSSSDKPVLYRRTTQYHGGERPGKPMMSDGLWTSRHTYDDDDASWRTSSTSPRGGLALHTGRAHSDSGVTVLDGEVLQPATRHHRSHHRTETVVHQQHVAPSRRHRTGSVESSAASSSLHGGSSSVTASDPGTYYVRRRSHHDPRRYRTVRRRIVEVDEEPLETVITHRRRRGTTDDELYDGEQLVEYHRERVPERGEYVSLPSARYPSSSSSYITTYD